MKNNAHSSFKYLCGRSHSFCRFFPFPNSFRCEVSDVLFRLVIGWLGSKLKNSLCKDVLESQRSEWMNEWNSPSGTGALQKVGGHRWAQSAA